MTKVLNVRNVNEALVDGVAYLKEAGIREDSRNGAVLVAPGPVMTEYERPWERVLFNSLRDANPFFHLMESLWMLAGRDDVAFPAYYAANITSFSDDGELVAGAYGNRWRSRFGYDQLAWIISELKKNPQSRRCVLTMWDAYGCPNLEEARRPNDLFLALNGGKDVPCNTQVYFDTVGGKLNMTVTCRSNDAVWGAYGANAVHFSFLHQYVADSSGIVQGVYRQFSNNFHAYIERPDTVRLFSSEILDESSFYIGAQPVPLISTDRKTWDQDLNRFFRDWAPGYIMHTSSYTDDFFRYVAVPMQNAHHFYKQREDQHAIDELSDWSSCDWKLAGSQWLQRRLEKRNAG